MKIHPSQPTKNKSVCFATDVDQVTFFDGPTEQEKELVYDLRDEVSVFNQLLKELQQGSPSPSTTSFAQSLETLYKKGLPGLHPADIHRRVYQVVAAEKTTTASTTGSTSSHNTTFRIPRHMKWAIRTLCGSDHRGLENVYRIDAVRQHREAVHEAILSQGGVVTDDARLLLRQAAYVAMLKGHGDAQQVEHVGGAVTNTRPRTSSSTTPRTIANPAA